MKHYSLFKLIALLLPMAVLMGSLSSCGDKHKDEPSVVEASPTSLSFTSEGGDMTLSITSSGKWSVTGDPSWITLSKRSGKSNQEISVKVGKNSSLESREAVLYISTDDDESSVSVRVTQEGESVSLSTDVNNIVLSSRASSQGLIMIYSNSSWTLTGVPDWLTVSSLSRQGNSSITVIAKTANQTSTPRRCNLVFTSNGVSVSVSVTQEEGLASIKVKPSNITALYNSMAFDYEYIGDVLNYRILYAEADLLDRYTDEEVITVLQEEERDTPDDSYVTWITDLSPNKKYVLCTLAYDKSGNQGELVRTYVTTPKNVSLDALAYIENVNTTSSSYIYWSTKKSASCSTYHMMASGDAPFDAVAYQGPDGKYFYNPYVIYAWIMKYNLVNNKEAFSYWNYSFNKDLINNGDFQFGHTPSASLYFIATWGLFANGELSPSICANRDFIDYYLQNNSSAQKVPAKNIRPAEESNVTKGRFMKSTFKDFIFR